ncbi:MAG TPA: peptidoglycan DD-metalloendopeptidase family protein [Longimicrobiales bacterium]|nr:peptidoglycan DD-metalloendopeptidase family protein [Longimicrobiales bacterium]
MSPRTALLALALAGATAAMPAAAQQPTSAVQRDLRDSRAKLDSIQNERQRLQREMDALRTRVRDTSRELVNIEKQRDMSRDALQELEFQTLLLNENVETTMRQHEETKTRLAQRSRDLNERLRAIYKRGPMHTVQVILTAQGFGDLMVRYRYLHMMALYDRMVLQDVTRLERELAAQEDELRESLVHLETLKQDKSMEVAELERVERQRQSTLRTFRQQETQTASRLTELEREQARMTSTIADLERRRREEEARGATPAQPASLTTRDLGTLQWPVDGTVVYRFGPDRKPNGIVLKNQGIGIGAAAGAQVKAVESGVVEIAGPYPGYGNSVIISHGGGYRTLYLYLRSVSVQVGQQITSGQAIGTVGGEQMAEGPHIEFQVRVPTESGIEAVDPLAWLRARAGAAR